MGKELYPYKSSPGRLLGQNWYTWQSGFLRSSGCRGFSILDVSSANLPLPDWGRVARHTARIRPRPSCRGVSAIARFHQQRMWLGP
jgi:hypothetical protein